MPRPAKQTLITITAIYTRVSTNQQTTRGQKADLQRWLQAQDPDKLGSICWFEDKATGKDMDRPGWQKLQAEIDASRVEKLVVWRLDRLGRTASGLCKLFEDLQAGSSAGLPEGFYRLGIASGRLIANVLASVAAYETEIRGECVKTGQAAVTAAGKKWGGSKRGWHYKVTPEQIKAIHRMKAEGEKITISRGRFNLSHLTIYRVLEN